MEHKNKFILEYINSTSILNYESVRRISTSHLIATQKDLNTNINTATKLIVKFELEKYTTYLDRLEGDGWTEFLIFTLGHNKNLINIVNQELDRRVRSN